MIPRCPYLALLLLLAAASATPPVRAAPADSLQAVEDCVTAEMARKDIPGASIAVALDGQVVFSRAYGVKHRDSNLRVDPGTAFRIGNLTKLYTAIAVMQQLDAGRLDLHAPVTRYVPEFELPAPWDAENVTVRQLLTHSSGLPDRFHGLYDLDHAPSLAEWAALQGGAGLLVLPGSFWNYNGPGFSLAGHAVERLTGLPFAAALARDVAGPAGLAGTFFDPDAVMSYDNFAVGHTDTASYGPRRQHVPARVPSDGGFATADDLVRTALILMNGGEGLLTPASAAAMQAHQIPDQLKATDFHGFGMCQFDFWGTEFLGDDQGDLTGWGAQLWWSPERRFAVAALGNATGAMGDSAFCAMREVLALDPPAAPPDESTPPSSWTRYSGTYRFRDAFGAEWTSWLGTVGDRLTMIDLDSPRDLVGPYRQQFRNTFEVKSSITPERITFIADPNEPSATRWVRGHDYVGSRVPITTGKVDFLVDSRIAASGYVWGPPGAEAHGWLEWGPSPSELTQRTAETVLVAPDEFWAELDVTNSGAPVYYRAVARLGDGQVFVGATFEFFVGRQAGLTFDGINDFVVAPPEDVPGPGGFTIEAWLKPGGSGTSIAVGPGGLAAVPLVVTGAGRNGGPAAFLGIAAERDTLVAHIGGPEALSAPVTGTTSLSTEFWTHAALVYDGQTLRLYRDGKLEGQRVVEGSPMPADATSLGFGAAIGADGTPSGAFDGALDEVRLWTYPRSAAQIASAMRAEIERSPGLVGRWPFDERMGLRSRDYTGDMRFGVLYGPLWTEGAPLEVTVPEEYPVRVFLPSAARGTPTP